jgi:hypothetical protein
VRVCELQVGEEAKQVLGRVSSERERREREPLIRGKRRSRKIDVYGPSCRAGEEGLARHRGALRPPAKDR